MNKLRNNLPIMLYAGIFAALSISPAFAQETRPAQQNTTTTAPAGEPKTPNQDT